MIQCYVSLHVHGPTTGNVSSVNTKASQVRLGNEATIPHRNVGRVTHQKPLLSLITTLGIDYLSNTFALIRAATEPAYHVRHYDNGAN
jgi:hypothetical protein